MIAEKLLLNNEKDIRKVLQIAKLISPKDSEMDVLSIIVTFLKYQETEETEFN